MGSNRSARVAATLAGAVLVALGMPALAGAQTEGGGAQELVAGPPEVVSVTYYDRAGRVIGRLLPREPGGVITPDQNCLSLPRPGERISPACGGAAPSGCLDLTARHGFDRWLVGSVWLYHTVGWCWGNWVVTWAGLRNHWREIGAGTCGASAPRSWQSGGGVGASYVSYYSQVDVSCAAGWVHTTIWMNIGHGGYGNYWAIGWSQH